MFKSVFISSTTAALVVISKTSEKKDFVQCKMNRNFVKQYMASNNSENYLLRVNFRTIQ